MPACCSLTPHFWSQGLRVLSRNRVAVHELLGLCLEVRHLLGVNHINYESVLGLTRPGELLAVDAVDDHLAHDVVELPRYVGLLEEVSNCGCPLAEGNAVVLVDRVLNVVLADAVHLETVHVFQGALPRACVCLGVILVVLTVLEAPLPEHCVVKEVVGQRYRLSVLPLPETALPGNGREGGLAGVGGDPLLLGSVPDHGIVWDGDVVLNTDEGAPVRVVLSVGTQADSGVPDHHPDAVGSASRYSIG